MERMDAKLPHPFIFFSSYPFCKFLRSHAALTTENHVTAYPLHVCPQAVFDDFLRVCQVSAQGSILFMDTSIADPSAAIGFTAPVS